MKGKIFNAQEVQSIIAGTKTMFREVIKKPLKDFDDIKINQYGDVSAYNKTTGWYEELKIKCPYQVGQKIKPKPKSGSIDLQLKLFNTELLIKEIRVERLQGISEEDARKEGAKASEVVKMKDGTNCYTDNFQKQWMIKYGIDNPKCWEANPWIWRIEFEVIK